VQRWHDASPRAVDAGVAAVLLVAAQLEVWLSPEVAGRRPETALAAAAMAVALAGRRAAPLASLAAVLLPFALLSLAGALPVVVFLLPVSLLAMYSVAAHAASDRAVVGLALGLVAVAITAAQTQDATLTDLTAPALLFLGAWAVGRSQRGRRHRLGIVEDRAARVEREHAERERAAVAEERRRIARELHDIVAHSVSTMVVQAETGLATMGEPARTEAAFAAIGTSGRQALGDLRRMLGLLRDPEMETEVAPQPGLARLPALIAEARRAGLPVEAQVAGDIASLPTGVDLAAYRVVQESLTNVLRHARTPTEVHVRRAPAAVEVVVRNPLPAAPASADGAGPGYGLAGMRERVRVYRGTFSAGPAGEEFVVRASLPLDDAEP